MKVTNKPCEKHYFSDLHNGDVFKYVNGVEFFMKITPVFYDCDIYDYEHDRYCNTVKLLDGSVLCTNETRVVIPVDCELIVK